MAETESCVAVAVLLSNEHRTEPSFTPLDQLDRFILLIIESRKVQHECWGVPNVKPQ